MYTLDSPIMQNHFAFRNYLIAHPEAADEYAQIKLALADKHSDDRASYSAGKRSFITGNPREGRPGVRIVPHRSITVSDADQLAGLLREGTSFVDCTFDAGSFAGLSVDTLELTDCSLQDSDLSHLTCGELRISRCDLRRADFYRADIKESQFTDSNCASARFPNAKMNLSRLIDSDFSLCSFEGASLFGADLTGSRFRAVSFGTTNIDGATVDRVTFVMASIAHKSFRKQRLVGVDFSEADLSGCDFTDAVFEDCRIENPIVSPETTFAGADLRGARLSNLRLDIARATGAVISQSQAAGFLQDTYGVLVADG